MQRHEANQAINAIMEQLKSECQRSDSEQPVLPDHVLSALTSTVPMVLNSALHILDHGKVTKFICLESRRAFYRVKESTLQS